MQLGRIAEHLDQIDEKWDDRDTEWGERFTRIERELFGDGTPGIKTGLSDLNARLDQRLDRIERELFGDGTSGIKTGLSDLNARLDQRLDRIDRELFGDGTLGIKTRLSTLDARLDQRLDRIDRELFGDGTPGIKARLSTLDARLDQRFDRIERELFGDGTPGVRSDVPALSDRVAELLADTTSRYTSTQINATPSSVSGIPLDPHAVYGGVLNVSYTSEGPTFSSWEEASGVAFSMGHPIHNMILQTRTWGTFEDYSNLTFFEIHPDLATSWSVSEDGLQWTFNLRDGVFWSDGTPFTCSDAKWSFDSIRTGEGLHRSPRALAFHTVKANVSEGFVCTDDLTLLVNHDRPKAAFLEVMSMPYHYMRPKHIYENDTDLMRRQPAEVGTGPFSFGQWLPGESYTFERKDDYWDQPFPYVDQIRYALLTIASNEVAFRVGRLDIYPGINRGRADAMLRECTDCVFFDRSFDAGFQAVMTHHQRPPWNTQPIKDAISYAMDRTRIGEFAADGWMTPPIAGPFYPGSAWDMPDDLLATIPGYDFSDPAGNKDKARQILVDAGYKEGELTLSFSIWNVASVAATAVVIQEELEAVGFDIHPILLDTVRAYQAWIDGDFDVGIHNFWVAGLDPDIVLYEHFYSGSDRNYNRYSKLRTDRVIDEMSGTVDPKLRKQRAWDVAEIILRDHGKHLIGYGSRIGSMQPRVGG